MQSYLVDTLILERGLELLKYRPLPQVSKGQYLGPASYFGKLLRSRHYQTLMTFTLESLGPIGAIMNDEDASRVSRSVKELYASYFTSSALRIGGGT